MFGASAKDKHTYTLAHHFPFSLSSSSTSPKYGRSTRMTVVFFFRSLKVYVTFNDIVSFESEKKYVVLSGIKSFYQTATNVLFFILFLN